MKITVIICTYNPVEEIFDRCLVALKRAINLLAPLEILIVDNNSPLPIGDIPYIKTFLAENSSARVVVEPEQGLTRARLTGIRESKGELLVFLDDDNFLDESYLVVARDIYLKNPFIGAYSGQVSLVYENEPPGWTKRYWGMLIYRKLDRDVWSNLPFNTDTMPNGAGMCVTRDTAEYYLKLYTSGKRGFDLDRSKNSLLSGGDNDLAMCACDIGKGMGLFRELHLQHHIPPQRFTLEYLKNLTYGIYFSSVILRFMREGKAVESTRMNKLKMFVLINASKKHDRIILRSSRKGLSDGIKFVRSNLIGK